MIGGGVRPQAESAESAHRHRQTDSFNWDTNPRTPRLYFKPAPPLRLPRLTLTCWDYIGSSGGMEEYNASPAESRLPFAPLVTTHPTYPQKVWKV